MGTMIKIKRIQVKNLFNISHYTYDLDLETNSIFAILYGNNGTGKTTILTILFHLLNPTISGGHRNAIAQIPFSEFSIDLSNGDHISIIRSDKNLQSYLIVFPYENEKLEYYFIARGEEQLIRNIKNRRSYYLKYCSYLSSLSLNIVYLPANRKIYEDQIIQNNRGDYSERDFYSNENFSEKKQLTLSGVVKEFNNWVHEQTISLTKQGNDSIDQHYYKVIENILDQDTNDYNIETINDKIKNLISSSQDYVKLGLINSFALDKFSEKLVNIEADKQDQVIRVLQPYIQSIEKRLEALFPIKEKLLKFYECISSMFIEKEISIDAEKGLSIRTSNGDNLKISQLSSGEKHILYLFCSIIAASSESSLVIIDEPEISLNATWQREFLFELNNIIGESGIQVILASHSFDLITSYEDSIVGIKIKK